MSITIEFKFALLDFVQVTAYGLNYRGRVEACVSKTAGIRLYEVEYVDDGAKICSGTFREDELEQRK